MKRIRATAEIKALKIIIRERTDEVVFLRNENKELRKQLEESRAKEGKGALEKMIEGIADAFANIGGIISSMSPDELKALADGNDDADCVDDCDFDCEHCERANLDEEDDT